MGEFVALWLLKSKNPDVLASNFLTHAALRDSALTPSPWSSRYVLYTATSLTASAALLGIQHRLVIASLIG